MGKIQDTSKKHWTETVIRIERLNREQSRLEERLVRLCARLAGLPLAHSSSGSSLGMSKDDADLLVVLERISAELGGIRNHHHRSSRGGSGYRQKGSSHAAGSLHLAGIVNELWMIVSQRKAVINSVNSGSSRTGIPDEPSSLEWSVVDEGELRKVLEVSCNILAVDFQELSFWFWLARLSISLLSAGPIATTKVSKLSDYRSSLTCN